MGIFISFFWLKYYFVRQVLVNLLSNAEKFTSTGKISVSCKEVQQEVGSSIYRFEVSDTGIGM